MKFYRNECGDTVSDCGRVVITPEYWGCVKPQSYKLTMQVGDKTVTQKHDRLKDAKQSAINRLTNN
jgi:hypothetical protein